MIFGKLINGCLNVSAFIITEGNGVIITPTSAQFKEYGYKPVIYSAIPIFADGFEIVEVYRESESEIFVNYELKEIQGDI
jgi:hypothetical protein